ncbi:PC-Esterase [Quillaja saponaria]|uniref:PC-Esterase n=1 Tax=Quillaja saponaria TaxID=32244 RepID=A0AAD7LLA2_QUISA|nr:PC-Esterase [Quillaja saponaria]
MGMAGWHLSRNKVLFFSGALFITLAVGVHLTPYFPSMTDFVTSVSSIVVLDNRVSCISLLHEIVWEVKPRDSQARFVALSLLNLVLDAKHMESVSGFLFKRHSNYQIVVDEIGMKLDFIWAPYTTNLTNLVMEFKQNHTYPDVLVMGSGLWHMLHNTNASDYGASLQPLRNSVASLLPVSPEFGTDGPVTGSVSIRSPHLFWHNLPILINSMLNTVEKRKKMTDIMRGAYDRELHKSKLLRKSGGPFLLLDIESLSWNCGVRCTDDGMHYDESVYEAAVQIMLNALLIESHQKL